MDGMNQEIDDMYKVLITEKESSKNNLKLNYFTKIMVIKNYLDVNYLKQLNDVKDIFRQHINNRRNDDQKELLMDERLIEKLKNIKVLSYSILQKFKSLNTSENTNKNDNLKSFSDLDDFNKYVSVDQEIISSELWKIDVLLSYLDDK